MQHTSRVEPKFKEAHQGIDLAAIISKYTNSLTHMYS